MDSIKSISGTELANVLTHAIGVLFGLIAVPFLVWNVMDYEYSKLIGILVYGGSFLLLFSASTLYHWIQIPNIKLQFQKLDHISIYGLIAGTYTPFIVIFLPNRTGWTILILLWVIAAVGFVYKLFFLHRYNFISTMIYLAMGWILLISPKAFFEAVPMNILIFIGIGGGSYTFGVVFYLWEKWKYHHAIWHLFVLGGSIFHFLGVYMATKY